MTHAIVQHKVGGPEVLQWEEIHVPDPEPTQARVRHTAIGVNYLDIYHRSGAHKIDNLPVPIGMEGAGVVTEVGPGVDDLKVGDRVCYHALMGSYTEERLAPAARLIPIPDGIDDKIAASMMMKGMTAEYLIMRCYPVKSGDTVLVHAAAGGVGTIICQWLKHIGATVIGTVSTDAKVNLAKSQGCDHVIVSSKETVSERVKEITDGKIDKSMFVITKSLSGYYKNPEGIAHKVLADRMAERNPGNKPKPNDRIPFMYRVMPKELLYDYNNLYKSGARKGQPRDKKVLQGDRIEHPDYMAEKKIDIDYGFYISNQIMNPVKQVLDLEKSEEETQELFNEFI